MIDSLKKLAPSIAEPIPFQLIAGHPALDLVNTLDNRFLPPQPGPKELLYTYDDLLRFTHQSGLLIDSQLRKLKRSPATPAGRSHVLKQTLQLRESLAAVAYAALDEKEFPAPDLRLLQDFFQDASSHRRLTADSRRLGWSWNGLSRHPEAPLWVLSIAAEELFLSERFSLLRSCASDTCRWLFLDTSKNHTRRWCDMKICGNRMKARRFQARQP